MGDRPLRRLRSRPRLLLAAACTLVVFALLTQLHPASLPTRLLLAWNAGVGLYLALVARMVWRAQPEHIARRALTQDEGGHAVLLLSALASLACLGAIVAQLGVGKDTGEAVRVGHVLLAMVTIGSAWAFIHTIFALHYAHDYYARLQRAEDGGIAFTGTPRPLYTDFFYLAMIIGTSAQTADVAFTATAMRRTALWHCLLAFVFNTVLLALTINMAVNLLPGHP